MPRAKQFDRREAVRKAMELFWEKGYESTSLTDLTDHLGIGKGSFYATFESKESLFTECVEAYTHSNLPLLESALNAQPDIRVGLKKLLDDYVEGMLRDSNRKGCLMANSCAFDYGKNARVEEKILAHYNRIEELLVARMEKDDIPTGKARSVSAMIVTFLIGTSQQSKIKRDKSSYLATVQNMIGLLD